MAGVLEIFFSESHAFQDREVHTYQLMARVVGEALARAVLLEQKKALAAERSTMPQAIKQVRPTCEAAIAAAELPSRRASLPGAMTIMPQRAKHLPSHIRLWRVADWTAVVIVLMTASWIAYSYRRPAPSGASARQRSNATEQRAPLVLQKPVPVEREMSKPQTAPVPIEEVRKAARSTPRQVRVGDNEIDYISDDVTVRHFISQPALQKVPVPDYQVDYISEDVTVRHFTPKLAVVSSGQPAERGAATAHSK
jgi:hypothetical protein